jgi:CBS domain-containing protein
MALFLDRPVETVMRRELIFVNATESVAKAAQKMKEHGTGSILVEKEGTIAGILTERDILYKVAAQGLSPTTVKAGEVMSSPVVTIPPKTTIREALTIMDNRSFRRLVVVDGGKAVGLVSQRYAMGDTIKRRTPEGSIE